MTRNRFRIYIVLKGLAKVIAATSSVIRATDASQPRNNNPVVQQPNVGRWFRNHSWTPKVCKTIAQSHPKLPKRPLFYIFLRVQVQPLLVLAQTDRPICSGRQKAGTRTSLSWNTKPQLILPFRPSRAINLPLFGSYSDLRTRPGTHMLNLVGLDCNAHQKGSHVKRKPMAPPLVFSLGLYLLVPSDNPEPTSQYQP